MRRIRPSIIIAVFAILIFAGGYFTTIKDKRQNIKELEDQYQQLQSKLRKTMAVVKRKEEANRRLQVVSRRWQQAKRMLPEEENIPDLLGTLTKLGGREEVKVQKFRPLSKSTKEKYIELPIEIQITGGYHNIGRFMAALNNMERIVNVKGLTLSQQKGGGEEEEFVILANFTLITYISKGGKVEG